MEAADHREKDLSSEQNANPELLKSLPSGQNTQKGESFKEMLRTYKQNMSKIREKKLTCRQQQHKSVKLKKNYRKLSPQKTSEVQKNAEKMSFLKSTMQKEKGQSSVKTPKNQESDNLFDPEMMSTTLFQKEPPLSKTCADRQQNENRDFGTMLNTAARKLKKERDKNKILRHKLKILTKKPKESYQYLKNIGAEQVSCGMEWTSTLSEEVQKRSRLHYEKIKQVTSGLEDEFDEIIREKLNGAFRATVKEEILKFIQRQNSLADEEIDENILNSTLMNLKQEESAEVENQENDNLNGEHQSHDFLEDLSLSSVHTSDLSSYEDDISISSEEGDVKRKVSLKFAAEEIERVRQSRLSEGVKKRKGKKKNLSDEENGFQSPDSTSTPFMASPRRERKPNSKYFSNDIFSPFDVDFPASGSYKGPDASGMVRKKGRPRKENTVVSLFEGEYQTPVYKGLGASGVVRKRGRPRKYSHD